MVFILLATLPFLFGLPAFYFFIVFLIQVRDNLELVDPNPPPPTSPNNNIYCDETA